MTKITAYDINTMDSLDRIVDRTRGTPTIVNLDSRFVIVTYWWGRGNLNNNTARPCISFYEDLFKQITNFAVKTMTTSNKMNPEKTAFIKENIEKIVDLHTFTTLLNDKIQEYMSDLYSYAGIATNSFDDYDKQQKTLRILENLKKTGKTPTTYEFKTPEYLFVLFYFVSKEFIKVNKSNLIALHQIHSDMEDLKVQFLNKESTMNYKSRLDELSRRSLEINTAIKKSLHVKMNYTPELDGETTLTRPKAKYKEQKTSYLNKIYNDPDIQNKTLNDIIISELRYLNPLYFEEMIENWNRKCADSRCNYMAIEYPEFARPGGYQLAINAKPLFIKKCVELCGGRSVVYIDGDMTIRKYPIIFDLPDVDYMARGWSMDPRSSWAFEESITYDPYTFETSGGIMYFSNSEESRTLLDMWIYYSNKEYQKGKADDRIISLIFNTQKLLLNMKVVQLPIEYLWLTLDYSDRLKNSDIYRNEAEMESSIIVDHPECLTSEDTASGAGASNDRTPKFYKFIDHNIDPVSEEYYEYLAFPSAEYAEGMEDYFKYMGNLFYMDDGNEILYEKGFVEPGRNPEENEQPLYIYPFSKQFGKKNTTSKRILARANAMDTRGLFEMHENASLNIAIISESSNTEQFMSLLYALLKEGKNVLYKPLSADEIIYRQFLSGLSGKYKRTEFAFVPIFNGHVYNDIFRPLIDVNNCIFISHTSLFMQKFITMFDTFQELVAYINHGSYQWASSVRVAYLIKKRVKRASTIGSGLNTANQKNVPHFAYEDMYLNATQIVETFKRREATPKGGTPFHPLRLTRAIKKNKMKNRGHAAKTKQHAIKHTRKSKK